MKYLGKYWLSDHGYLAVLENALVLVTTDDAGQPVRCVIFERDNQSDDAGTADVENMLKHFDELLNLKR